MSRYNFTENSVYVRTNGGAYAFARESLLEPRSRVTNFTMDVPGGKLEPFAGWQDPPFRAPTSASILTSTSGGDVKSHFLPDAGPGVGESLANSLLIGPTGGGGRTGS